MRALTEAKRQHIRSLLAQADTEALLNAVRQANMPDAEAWSERLQAVQGAYDSQRVGFDIWLREHIRVFSAILHQLPAQKGAPPPPPTEIEVLVLQKHIEEALRQCQDVADEPLLLHAQYALGFREFEGGRLPLASWEILQQRLGYALVVFLEAHARRENPGCLNALFRRR